MQMFKKIFVRILTWEARAVLARYKPNIISVTGSVGKTTTKDAIYAALAPELRVRKSQKSFNSEIGVPLTILGLDNAWHDPLKWFTNILRGALLLVRPQEYPKWLVLEVGADRPGDIRSIAAWLRPDIVVYTGVPEVPVHVEYFSSPAELFREKRSLAEYLKPGGTLILNGDDPHAGELVRDFRGASVTFGLDEDKDLSASHAEILYTDSAPVGMQFRANGEGVSLPIQVFGALGYPRVYAALAALCAAKAAGLDMVSASKNLVGWEPPPGRVRILRGLKGSIIIDDTYNSSPAAAYAALDILKEVKATRRIAILGDMLELGKYSADQHKKLGERAAVCADILITVGFRMRAAAEAALGAGMLDSNIFQYEMGEAVRAANELQDKLQSGDVVLVKGSQSMRLEKTVHELMAEPQNAPELLVRMDPEWQMR